MNSVTMFCAPTSSDMPADRGQQQRVELAVRGFARRQRAPRQQHRAGAAGDQDQRQRERQVVDRAARPRRSTSCAFHCQIVRPSAAPSATSVSAGTSCARDPARAAAGRPAAPRPRRRAARSAARAPAKSMCGPLQVGASRATATQWPSAVMVASARDRCSRTRSRPAQRRVRRRRTARLDRAFAAVQRELRVEREEQDHGDQRHEHERRRASAVSRECDARARRGCASRG